MMSSLSRRMTFRCALVDSTRLTSNTPLSTILFIDPADDRSDDEPRKATASVQETNLGTVRIPEIGVPGFHGLQSRDDGAVI